MRSLLEIFYVFAGVGALTFGGGYTMLPLLQKMVAGRRNWATEEEITDFYAVAQCLPGIIAANTAMLIGHKLKGYPGMLAAALGVITPSILVILVIALFIENLLRYEIAAHAFGGVRVAVLALIFDAAYKMWKTGVKDLGGLLIFTAMLLLLLFAPLSPVLPLLSAAVCGIVIQERRRKVKTGG